MVAKRFTLHLRIAAGIFVLEALLVLVLLGVTLDHSTTAMEKQISQTEHVVLDLLGDIARVALLTGEYDDLQAHVERASTNDRIEKLIIYDSRGIAIVASDVTDVGMDVANMTSSPNHQWRQKKLENASGSLGHIAIKYNEEILAQARQDSFEVGLLVAIFGIVAITIFSIGAGFFVTRKLVVLSSAAQNISEGNLDVEVGLKGNDEIARLGQTFDEMVVSIKRTVAALKAREAELKSAHGQLEERVRERTEELAEARDDAVKASRAKSEFLANMSHELRTPLNAIIGYSELMLEDMEYEKNNNYIEDLSKIRSSGKHLLGLVNNVLDLSKIEAGKMKVHIEEVLIDTLINDVVSNTKPLIDKNNNSFSTNYVSKYRTMRTDGAMLKQTLINLLGNAAKFTHDGRIELVVEDSEFDGRRGIRFIIVDSGIGMSSDQTVGLFEQFAQADTSHTRKYEGTGLGLTISRKFAQLLGGEIGVESELNKGSRFYIWLPLQAHLQTAQD